MRYVIAGRFIYPGIDICGLDVTQLSRSGALNYYYTSNGMMFFFKPCEIINQSVIKQINKTMHLKARDRYDGNAIKIILNRYIESYIKKNSNARFVNERAYQQPLPDIG